MHLGAVRSFLDNYNALRPSNVHPIKELVKLATPCKIPIHFISTAAVLAQDVGAASSAAENVPPTDGTEGYLATKWASERILERSTAGLAVPSFIYRLLPSTQTPSGHSKREVLDESYVAPA